MFVDDSVLVGMDVISKGTGRSSLKMGEELMLGIERDDREGEFWKDRSRQGRQGYNSNRGFNDSRWEVFD